MSESGIVVAKPIKVALRFSRRDAQHLRRTGDLMNQVNGTDDRSIFHKAADSAEIDEPLIVTASTKDEVERMADRFASYGFDRPAIDELNG